MYRGHDFYVENRVSWPRVRQGFIDREALYGTNLRVLNAFCKLAGSAGDRATTRAVLERIGDHWDPDRWTRKSFDNYRTWAFRQGGRRQTRRTAEQRPLRGGLFGCCKVDV